MSDEEEVRTFPMGFVAPDSVGTPASEESNPYVQISAIDANTVFSLDSSGRVWRGRCIKSFGEKDENNKWVESWEWICLSE